MSHYDIPEERSCTERQLRRLVVPEPAAYASDKRLDVIHDPDLDLLWGAQVGAPRIDADPCG